MLPIGNRCPASNTLLSLYRCANSSRRAILFFSLFHQHFFCSIRAATSCNTYFEELPLATVASHRYHLLSP
jgi:hypothetical protein